MKIGFITTYFYPHIGGAENNCFYLSRELAKIHEVHVFTSHKGQHKYHESIEGIHIHRSREIFRFGYYAAFYPGMLLQVLNTKLDVLHVHSYGFLWHDIIVSIKKIFNPKLKLVITPHGPFMALDNYPFHARVYRNIVNFIEYPVNNIYDIIFQVNPFQKEWLVNHGFQENKIKYLPNGISKELFEKIDNSDFTKKYKLRNKIVMSFIGRLQRYKGVDQAIRVLNKLPQNVVLFVLGSGEDKERLVKLVSDSRLNNRVFFLNGNNILRNKLLKSSDVLIFPSKWEAFGIVILEAMAFGKAIISTMTEGGKFLVEDGKNGFLFNFGNLTELEEKLNLVINNRKLRDKIRINNIKKSKEFLWENIVNELERSYAELK